MYIWTFYGLDFFFETSFDDRYSLTLQFHTSLNDHDLYWSHLHEKTQYVVLIFAQISGFECKFNMLPGPLLICWEIKLNF